MFMCVLRWRFVDMWRFSDWLFFVQDICSSHMHCVQVVVARAAATLVLSLCLLATVPVAGALPPLSLKQLVGGAQVIVHGRVAAIQHQETQLDAQGYDFVDDVYNYTVEVLRTLKRDESMGRWFDTTLHIEAHGVKKRPAGWTGPQGHTYKPQQVGDERVFFARVMLFDKGATKKIIALAPNGLQALDVLEKLPASLHHPDHEPLSGSDSQPEL